jgi:nucleoside phosphorylase
MGVSEARIAVQEMVRMFEPCGIIDFGTAGALSESWPIGQSALVERAYAYETPVVIPSSPPPQPPPIAETLSFPEWLKLGRDTLSMRTVGIGSADEPVLNPHLAHYLSSTFPFDWVDCESHAVLTTAAQLEVPAIGLRTVTDYCGWDAEAQFRNNAGRALRGAAKVLEKFAVALYEAGQLTA